MILKQEKKKSIIVIGTIAVLILAIGFTILGFTLKPNESNPSFPSSPYHNTTATSYIALLEMPNISKGQKYRNERILREFKDHQEIRFFQGSATWKMVNFPFKLNKWKNDSMISKPGVYEWAVSPPCHHKKIFSIYRGFSSKLATRFRTYIHEDGIYPKGEQGKTLYFKELLARGFQFYIRFLGTDRGSQYARHEEEYGPQGGLRSVDYPFNKEQNGGYRQPFFIIGNSRKSVIDFPFISDLPNGKIVCQ